MRRILLATLLLCAAVLPACVSVQRRAADSPEGPGDRDAVESLSRRFAAAFLRGDAETMAGLYTEDGVVVPDGAEAVRGRAAIRTYWAQPSNQGITRYVARPTEIRFVGNVAHEYGTYEVTARGASLRGNYVIVWRRTGEGWRMDLDTWNQRPGS
jgi:uncharacterized protein (TIGR02246 family)